MADYLIHMTAAGTPVGVYTPTSDYYDPQYEHLRAEGREVVYSKLPSVSWTNFINRLASTRGDRTMRWDVYKDTSPSLSSVLSHAVNTLVTTGAAEEE